MIFLGGSEIDCEIDRGKVLNPRKDCKIDQVPRKCKGSAEEMAKKCHGCAKEVLRKCQGSGKEVPRMWRKVLWMSKVSAKVVQRKCQENA